MDTALILVDIQNDYFPGGAMELEGSVEAGFNASRLLAFFREKGLPVVHIRHVSVRPGATFFLPGTKGAQINEAVRPLEGEAVFEKHFPNSFRDTPLLEHLRGCGATQVAVCGMMTHMCVDATVRAAFDLGFGCLVAQDACATRALTYRGITVPAQAVQVSFMAALDAVYARVLDTDEVIAHLSRV
jgi:nicotinamidase-related amidase